MIELGKFTPYYLVSTIFPGIFNAGMIYFVTTYQKNCTMGNRFYSLEWLFILLFFIFATLVIGMCVEKIVFRFLRFTLRLEKMILSIISPARPQHDEAININYDSLAKWREKLLDQVSEEKELKSRQLIAYVEKLMSEYYFLNNVIPGIIASAIIILFCFDCSKGWLFVVVSRIITVGITFVLLWLVAWVMRILLFELHRLQSKEI